MWQLAVCWGTAGSVWQGWPAVMSRSGDKNFSDQFLGGAASPL